VTERRPGFIAAGGGKMRIDGIVNGDNGTHMQFTHIGGPPLEVTVAGPHVKLVPVTDDRFGTTFAVPTEHLGQPLKEQTPLEIASLAFAYLKNLIADGSKLAA
jgi:hypothetical protein